MWFQTRLALDSASCAFAHESAHLSGEIMHKAVLASQLLKLLLCLGLCSGFPDPLSRTGACALNLPLETRTVIVSLCVKVLLIC